MFKPGAPKPPNSGRKKGSRNKTTLSMRQAFIEAFQKRGGVQALLAWAANNETEFYRLCGRLIPQEVTGRDGGKIELQHSGEIALVDRIAELEPAFLGAADREKESPLRRNGIPQPVHPSAN